VRRETVLEAALAVIAEKGLDETRMVDIGDRAGMSAGHVMYYFPTKADLLMHALAWSEDRFLAEAEQAIEGLPSARTRLWRLVELSFPSPGVDPAWILWLETWAHAPHDAAVAAFQRRIEDRWLALLARVVREGQGSGELPDVDVERFVTTLSAIVDGLSIRWMGGNGALDRDELLRICRTEIELGLPPRERPGLIDGRYG
jgi:AcrR family transcriptional regulator